MTVQAQQIFGGHGYIEEWGMSQYVRDARIAMIYEGANGIQALDLVGRKLPQDNGKYILEFLGLISKFIKENNEKRKREIIEIYDNETKERVEECEKINNLLSSTKRKYRKAEYDAMNHNVKLFAYGADNEASSPARNTRSYSDPVRGNEQENTNSPQRSSSAGDGVYIKQETQETQEKQVKRGPGRPRKVKPANPQ